MLLLINKALEEPLEKPGSHLREGLSSEEVAPLHLLHLPPYISVPGLHEGLWDAREEEEEEDEEEEAEPDGDEDPVVPLVFLGKPEYFLGYHPIYITMMMMMKIMMTTTMMMMLKITMIKTMMMMTKAMIKMTKTRMMMTKRMMMKTKTMITMTKTIIMKTKTIIMKTKTMMMMTKRMMMKANFLHPGILTPFSFIREHQTPLLPAPDN